MPQMITGSTVLPDTLKVPIMPSILMPSLTVSHIKEHPIPTVITAPTPAAPQLQLTPKQTPVPNVKLTPRENVSTRATTTQSSTSIVTLTSTPISTSTSAPTPSQALNTNTPTTNTVTTATSTSTTSSTETKTPTLAIRHSSQAPKSPPRWPLRPGVMVHVSSDTKENLAVNRMTLKPNATLANLTASTVNDSSVSASTLNNSANTTQTTLLNVTAGNAGNSAARQTDTLGRIGRRPGRVDRPGKQVEVVSTNTNNNEQTSACHTTTSAHQGLNANTLNSTSTDKMMSGEISADLQTELRNLEESQVTGHAPTTDPTDPLEIQRLTTPRDAEIRVDMRPTTTSQDQADCAAPADTLKAGRKSQLEKVEDFFANIFFKRRRASPANTCRDSQRSHVGLLGGKFWKRSENATPFATEHRLKGIRSSGSGN